MNENIWRLRWTKEQIRAMLLEQFQAFWQRDTGIQRTRLAEVEQASGVPHAVIISGLRRVGKSTLLAQLAHRVGEDKFYYVNFEDDRFLSFQAENANDLYQLLLEIFGERKIFILDEIQNVLGWEHFVRRWMEMGFKLYITGSNASLLSRELGTRLTGRYLPVELFPFSFKEYLIFKGYNVPNLHRLTTVDAANLQSYLYEYLKLGGIPEPLKYPDLPLLRTLYDDVLYRDIAARYHIEEVRSLKELAYSLISNPAGKISFNKLKGQLRLGSVNTVTNYVEYLKNSWLIFTLNVYDFSVKRQQIAPKKVYGIDTGLINAVGFAFSENAGKLLETLVFLALRQKSANIYYYTTPSGYEVDFFLPESKQLIQVSQNLENPAVRGRETRALIEAMKELNVPQGLILSDADLPGIHEHGLDVEIQSIAKWLLRQ